MGKYEPLGRYLSKMDCESWDARFEDIERVLGFSLPRSAYDYPAWWANQDGHHSQTKGWRDVGWETSNVDLAACKVRFVRRKSRSTKGNLASGTINRTRTDPSFEGLVEQAMKLSGITDRSELLATALTQLIQREAATGLIALGGTMPEAKAPPRRRFD